MANTASTGSLRTSTGTWTIGVGAHPVPEAPSLAGALHWGFARLRERRAETLPTLPWRAELVASLLGGLLIVGLFLDGWAHINLREGAVGPFLTPWHGVLYAGFTATALWMLASLRRATADRRDLPAKLAALPAGYGLALLGMGITGAAVGADAVWHTVFGEEEDVARVMAPSHLALFAGAALVLSAPFRAAWASQRLPAAPSFRQLLPALLSLALTTALVAFVLQFVSGFLSWVPADSVERAAVATPAAADDLRELLRVNGIVALLVTNLLLLAPALHLLRRWTTPFGSLTLLFGIVAVAMASLTGFERPGAIAAVLAGGLAADLLVRALRGAPALALRAVGGLAPVALWSAYFLALRVTDGTVWPLELWTGSIALAALGGVLLSTLVAPARATPA